MNPRSPTPLRTFLRLAWARLREKAAEQRLRDFERREKAAKRRRQEEASRYLRSLHLGPMRLTAREIAALNVADLEFYEMGDDLTALQKEQLRQAWRDADSKGTTQ